MSAATPSPSISPKDQMCIVIRIPRSSKQSVLSIAEPHLSTFRSERRLAESLLQQIRSGPFCFLTDEPPTNIPHQPRHYHVHLFKFPHFQPYTNLGLNAINSSSLAQPKPSLVPQFCLSQSLYIQYNCITRSTSQEYL